MRKKELQKQLDEKNERIALLSRRVETMQAMIESYQQREQIIVDAMANAQAAAGKQLSEAAQQAEKTLSEAEARAKATRQSASEEAELVLSSASVRAEATLKNAREQTESMLAAAREQSDQMLAAARERAERQTSEARAEAAATVAAARRESAALLRRTEESVTDYERQMRMYNEAIEKNVSEAMKNAAWYADQLRARKLPVPELAEEVSGMSEIPLTEPVELPDAEDDPKRIMMNIYKLQKRDIPEAEEERPVFTRGEPVFEPEPAPESAPEPEPESVPESACDPVPIPRPAEPGDAEPDEVPTVTQYLVEEETDTFSEGELSLDDLLNEIIQAGEMNNGKGQ